MKKSNTKSKHRPILNAAIFGGLLFLFFSAVVMIGTEFHFWRSGDFLGPDILLSAPTYFILHILHGDRIVNWLFPPHNAGLIDWLVYSLFSIINGLLAAFIFSAVFYFKQFVVKKNNHAN